MDVLREKRLFYGCTARGRIGDRGLLRNEGRGRMRSSIEKGWGTGMMSDRGLLRYCMREERMKGSKIAKGCGKKRDVRSRMGKG
jgi:hypothetical protein